VHDLDGPGFVEVSSSFKKKKVGDWISGSAPGVHAAVPRVSALHV